MPLSAPIDQTFLNNKEISSNKAYKRTITNNDKATGCRPASYVPGTCRSLFAQVATVIVATDDDAFELYGERYILDWLRDTQSIGDRISRAG